MYVATELTPTRIELAAPAAMLRAGCLGLPLASAAAAEAVAHHRRVPRRHRLQTRHSQPDRSSSSSARLCQLTAARAAIPSTCAWRAAPTAMASRSRSWRRATSQALGQSLHGRNGCMGRADQPRSNQCRSGRHRPVRPHGRCQWQCNGRWDRAGARGSSGGADERALRLRVPASGHRRSGWPPGGRRVWPVMAPAPCSPCTALERAGASSIQWLAPGSRKRKSNRAR